MDNPVLLGDVSAAADKPSNKRSIFSVITSNTTSSSITSPHPDPLKFKALQFIDDSGQGFAALAAIGPSKPNSLNSPVRILARFRRTMLDQDTNERFALRIRISDRGGDRQLKSLARTSQSGSLQAWRYIYIYLAR
jgi:hypothetical protein